MVGVGAPAMLGESTMIVGVVAAGVAADVVGVALAVALLVAATAAGAGLWAGAEAKFDPESVVAVEAAPDIGDRCLRSKAERDAHVGRDNEIRGSKKRQRP